MTARVVALQHTTMTHVVERAMFAGIRAARRGDTIVATGCADTLAVVAQFAPPYLAARARLAHAKIAGMLPAATQEPA